MTDGILLNTSNCARKTCAATLLGNTSLGNISMSFYVFSNNGSCKESRDNIVGSRK